MVPVSRTQVVGCQVGALGWCRHDDWAGREKACNRAGLKASVVESTGHWMSREAMEFTVTRALETEVILSGKATRVMIRMSLGPPEPRETVSAIEHSGIWRAPRWLSGLQAWAYQHPPRPSLLGVLFVKDIVHALYITALLEITDSCPPARQLGPGSPRRPHCSRRTDNKTCPVQTRSMAAEAVAGQSA